MHAEADAPERRGDGFSKMPVVVDDQDVGSRAHD
jgi:hypothetical protein